MLVTLGVSGAILVETGCYMLRSIATEKHYLLVQKHRAWLLVFGYEDNYSSIRHRVHLIVHAE